MQKIIVHSHLVFSCFFSGPFALKIIVKMIEHLVRLQSHAMRDEVPYPAERIAKFEANMQKSPEANIQKSPEVDHQNLMAVASVSNEEAPPQIFKLDIDCFEEIFDWLSLKDLLVLRRTCKRFKRLVNYYIKFFYPAFKLGRGKMKLHRHSIDQLRRVDAISAKSVNQITLWGKNLTEAQINDIKGILSHVKVLDILNWQIGAEFYESFLKFCPNVTHLTVGEIYHKNLIVRDNRWLHHEYPNLKYIEFNDCYDIPRENAEVKTFLELNPNIRTFATKFDFLLANRRWLIGSSVQFDVLRLEGTCGNHGMDQIFDLVKTLYDQGFYKRLHFHCFDTKPNVFWNQITTLPAVEALRLAEMCIPITISPLMNCAKEVHFNYFGYCEHPERLASFLSNVDCVHVEVTKSTDLLRFVRHSPRVREFHFNIILGVGGSENGAIIDVVALNREREQLAGARKQTIYVPEAHFLATKWTGMPTNGSLVQLKRNEACRQEHAFNIEY